MKSIIVFLLVALTLPLHTVAQDETVNAKVQQLAEKLATKIQAKGKTRVGITTLTDLQDNPIELGKYLAVKLQGYLLNNTRLRITNRTQLDKLLEENRLTAKGLLNPDSALKLKNVTGMELVIIGTITPFTSYVDLTVSALDLQSAEAIASEECSIPRTESIDQLIRTVVSVQPPINPTDPPQNSGNRDKELSKKECENQGYNYGKYCFENRFTEPLLLYKCAYKYDDDTNILVSPGAVSCSPLINLEYGASNETKFYFRTVREPTREGFITLTVNKCKSTFVALTPSNFYLKKAN